MTVVSIKCITYQHANFIRDAIEGFLMQETTFPVEILIHDDASTDGTAEIIKEYAARYPQLFRTVLQTENQWSKGVKPAGLLNSLVRGEFIAFCDGDDYWVDRLKLQKQVETLQTDERIALAWCKLQLIDESGKPLNRLPWNLNESMLLTLDQSVAIAMPGTPGVVLRRSRLDPLELEKFRHFPQGDYPKWITSMREDGLAYFSADCMACYRRHSGGLTAGFGRPATCRTLAEMWRQMAISVNRLDQPDFRRHISTHYMWAARGFADQARLGDSLLDLVRACSFSDQPGTTKAYEFGKNAVRAMVLWIQSILFPMRSKHTSR